MQFRVSTAEIDPIQVRGEHTVGNRAEIDEFRTQRAQQLQIVVIVKAKGSVTGDTDANTLGVSRRRYLRGYRSLGARA